MPFLNIFDSVPLICPSLFSSFFTHFIPHDISHSLDISFKYLLKSKPMPRLAFVSALLTLLTGSMSTLTVAAFLLPRPSSLPPPQTLALAGKQQADGAIRVKAIPEKVTVFSLGKISSPWNVFPCCGFSREGGREGGRKGERNRGRVGGREGGNK